MINKSLTYKKAIESIASNITIQGGDVLVTGACGLIGSCLIDVLLIANSVFNKSFHIHALGRNREKLQSRFGNTSDIKYVVQDIIEPLTIPCVEYVVHAASNADPRSYAMYPVETIVSNVVGTNNILEYCKFNNSKVLFTSTFEVYGKLERPKYDENSYGIVDLNLLRSCYPESKRVSEMLVKSYCDEYHVNAVTARLASIYGPTMQKDDSKAHAQFIRNGLAGTNIVLKSKGEQRRTYCYVMDAVSALITILFHGESGEVYNVANDKSVVSIAEMAQIVAEIAGTKVVFDYPDEIEAKGFSKPQDCILVTDKLKALGWEGQYDVKNGMLETFQILREIA